MLKQKKVYHKGRVLKVLFHFLFGFMVSFLIEKGTILCVEASQLDRIWQYTILVTPYEDGSLDMQYHIEWEVLDSSSEGPLEWIKIAVPNLHIRDLEALNDTITDISCYEDNGTYIRLDLDRDYYEGEVLDLDFRLRQYDLYEKTDYVEWFDSNGGEELRVYTFTPGWFDEIDVNDLNIFWDAQDVCAVEGEEWVYYEQEVFEDGIYCWKTNLWAGEKYTVRVAYEDYVFSEGDIARKSGGKVLMWVLPGILAGALGILVITEKLCRKRKVLHEKL